MIIPATNNILKFFIKKRDFIKVIVGEILLKKLKVTIFFEY